MVGNVIENNMVTIAGKVVSDIEFSHEVYGEGFYSFRLDVSRLSSSSDSIPVIVSERLFAKQKIEIGLIAEIEGQFRSYNSFNSENSKLILTVFAREINFLDDEKKIKNPNQIYLNGYVCKRPIYRTTPFGREITDMLLAVNRPYNKSDYIPCIAWGRNARYCEGLQVGENIRIWGRIQSRTYQKKLNNGEVLTKTAYEVSISKMEIGTEEGNQDNEGYGNEDSSDEGSDILNCE